jgi:hypothetical protein
VLSCSNSGEVEVVEVVPVSPVGTLCPDPNIPPLLDDASVRRPATSFAGPAIGFVQAATIAMAPERSTRRWFPVFIAASRKTVERDGE